MTENQELSSVGGELRVSRYKSCDRRTRFGARFTGPAAGTRELLTQPLSPIARPAMRVRHSKDENLVLANEVDDAERKLAKNVSAAEGEVGRPALRRPLQLSIYRSLKLLLRIYGGGKTSFIAPGKRRQLLSVGFWMEA